MSDIEVTTSALTAHASQVESLMSELRGAAVEGDQLFDPRAFGLIGSVWSQALQQWCSDAKGHVDTTAGVGNQIGVAMREMAASYDDQDQQHSSTFGKIGDSMSGMG